MQLHDAVVGQIVDVVIRTVDLNRIVTADVVLVTPAAVCVGVVVLKATLTHMVFLVDARPAAVTIVEPSTAVLTRVLVAVDLAAGTARLYPIVAADAEHIVTVFLNVLVAAVNVGHQEPTVTAQGIAHHTGMVRPAAPLGVTLRLQVRLDGLVST